MNTDAYFRELLQATVSQIQLFPSIAQRILEGILKMLKDETDTIADTANIREEKKK